MKSIILAAAIMFGVISPIVADPVAEPLRLTTKEVREMLVERVAYSCSLRKTCSKTVRSCDEAYWLMNNCSWGHRLDGDGDGVPCENLCPGG